MFKKKRITFHFASFIAIECISVKIIIKRSNGFFKIVKRFENAITFQKYVNIFTQLIYRHNLRKLLMTFCFLQGLYEWLTQRDVYYFYRNSI